MLGFFTSKFSTIQEPASYEVGCRIRRSGIGLSSICR
jgi:hypothetical protein